MIVKQFEKKAGIRPISIKRTGRVLRMNFRSGNGNLWSLRAQTCKGAQQIRKIAFIMTKQVKK